MSEQRFIVESVEIISDCNENKKRIAKVITDTDELYSYEDLYEVAELLNEQEDKITEQTRQHKARLDKLIEENGELRMKMVEQQELICYELYLIICYLKEVLNDE